MLNQTFCDMVIDSSLLFLFKMGHVSYPHGILFFFKKNVFPCWGGGMKQGVLHVVLYPRPNTKEHFSFKEKLYRNIGVEELVPWIWSGTNHHDISSLCPPDDSRSRGA